MSLFQSVVATPSPIILRFFALSWSISSGVGAFFSFNYFPDSSAWLWLLVATGVFSVGIVFPAMMKPVYSGIDRVFRPVGETVSLLLLALAYFVVFTLFALFIRWVGRDPLRLKSSGWEKSAWEKKNTRPHPFGYQGQY